MDRTEGQNYIDLGNGRRGFRDQNAEAGVTGTRVDAAFLNSIQEELLNVIEQAGLTADKTDWSQVFKAIRQLSTKIVTDYIIPLGQLNCYPWTPVISMIVKTPPTKPSQGDIYIVPDGANSAWSDKTGQIAEWNGNKWIFTTPRNGHGIGLQDGSVYIRINGQYVPLTDLFDKRYSKLTEPPTDTFYVIGPKGNDNNTGFSTSPDEGFQTIQGAINQINSRYMTTATITILVSPGTYEGFFISKSMVANWSIKSLTGDKKSVFIVATDPNKPVRTACSTSFGTQVEVCDMTLSGFGDTVNTTNGNLTLFSCDIVMGNDPNSQAVVCYGGSINLYGDMTISGSGIVIFHSTGCGTVGLGFYGGERTLPLKITYNDVKASWAAFVCEKNANISVAAAVVSFIGVPDSMSYTAFDNGIISTWGGGGSIFPGTREPWVGSGGILS